MFSCFLDMVYKFYILYIVFYKRLESLHLLAINYTYIFNQLCPQTELAVHVPGEMSQI